MKFSEKMIRVAFGMLIGGSIIAGSSYIAGACTSVSFDNGAIQLHKNDKVITLNSLNYNPGQSKEINEELSAFDEISVKKRNPKVGIANKPLKNSKKRQKRMLSFILWAKWK